MFADTRRHARRYAATLVTRAVATARRAHLLPYSRRLPAAEVATSHRTAEVPLAGSTASTAVWTFRDAAILPDEGIVVAPGRAIVLESAKAPWAFDRYGVLPLRPLRSARLDVPRVATITIPALRRSWGHWLLDSLPRLYLLDEVFGERGLHILIGKHLRGNYLAALRAYLPADYQLVQADAATLAVAAEVVLPGYLPVAQTGMLSPGALRWLTRIVPPRREPPSRRIYIARAADLDRQMTNEPEVRALLDARGFETVAPERLTFDDQVALFAGARLVVGTHGSGLTGIMYMSPGCALIEMFPAAASVPRASPAYNQRLASSAGLRYASIHGGARNPRDSFAISAAELADVLDRHA